MHFTNITTICGKDSHKFFVLKDGVCVPSPGIYMYVVTNRPVESGDRMICQFPVPGLKKVTASTSCPLECSF